MEVIGAGPGRTGTLSLKFALEKLGYPCHHMAEVLRHSDIAAKWARVLAGEQLDWSEIFADYRATVDWPSTARWRELIEAYPDAKVILTVRDPDRWATSMEQTILARAFPEPSLRQRVTGKLVGLTRPAQSRMFRQMGGVMADFFGTPVGRRPTHAEAVAAFERHREQVQATVAPDRLLTYEVAQGWQPLCEFLGVEVPDEPFPRVNESASFAQNSQRLQRFARVGRLARAAGSRQR